MHLLVQLHVNATTLCVGANREDEYAMYEALFR